MRANPLRTILLTALLLIALPSSSRAGEPAQVEAGLGRGVKVSAADGSLSLQVRARVQARAQLTAAPGEELGEEFLIRRARLQLQGHALDPSLTYYVQLGFSNSDTEPDLRLPLRDARISWAMARDAQLVVGQTKVPFNRQRTTSSSALQMVDRSLSNGELNLDRDVGLQLRSEDLFGWGGRLGYDLGVFGGDGRNRADAAGGGLLYVARVTLSPLGPLAGKEEADLGRGPLRAALGLAGAMNQGTRRARSTHGATLELGRVDTTHAAMDLAVRWRGASLNAEALMRRADRERLTGEIDGAPAVELTRSGWGYMLQGGYLLTDQLELTARHSAISPLGASAITYERESGGGVSWYVREQALKVQSDYLWRDGDARTGAHQVRVQLQLFL